MKLNNSTEENREKYLITDASEAALFHGRK
jgi:hypothetical protein